MQDRSELEQLSRTEIGKDALQEGVTAAAHTVGTVTTIVTTAVGDIAKALGGFATELFEIRDASRRASRDLPAQAAGEVPRDQGGQVSGDLPRDPVQSPKDI